MVKMMLTCSGLRVAVITSVLMLIASVLAGLVAVALPAVAVGLSHLALFSILGGAAVLAVTFLLTLLPGASRRLAECQH
jgi:hypothetical protein